MTPAVHGRLTPAFRCGQSAAAADDRLQSRQLPRRRTAPKYGEGLVRVWAAPSTRGGTEHAPGGGT